LPDFFLLTPEVRNVEGKCQRPSEKGPAKSDEFIDAWNDFSTTTQETTKINDAISVKQPLRDLAMQVAKPRCIAMDWGNRPNPLRPAQNGKPLSL